MTKKLKRANAHLSVAQIKTLKDCLLAEKEKTLNHLGSPSDIFQINQEERKDNVDEANVNLLISWESRLNNREHFYLKKIQRALDKVETSEYGNCDDCGGEIALPRLLARPTSELCINCKEDSEVAEKHNISDKKPKSIGQGLENLI
jgi:DnaK suppressor protein